jgi:hypothetical protein
MKRTFKKAIASVIAIATLSVATTGYISNAALSEYDYPLYYENIDRTITSQNFPFDVYSSTNLGSYVASSSTVTMSGAICTTGQALVKFHTWSYYGPVENDRVIPGPGNYPITSSISLTQGVTYFITVEPYGYNHATGGFTLS